jgi:hypothetical protein
MRKENGEEKKTKENRMGAARFVGWAVRASTPVYAGYAHAVGASEKADGVGTARRSQACADCVNCVPSMINSLEV